MDGKSSNSTMDSWPSGVNYGECFSVNVGSVVRRVEGGGIGGNRVWWGNMENEQRRNDSRLTQSGFRPSIHGCHGVALKNGGPMDQISSGTWWNGCAKWEYAHMRQHASIGMIRGLRERESIRAMNPSTVKCQVRSNGVVIKGMTFTKCSPLSCIRH